MIQPVTAHMVTRGEYDEYRIVAVFADLEGAERYRDHMNLTHPSDYRADRYDVDEIDYYGPGWTAPPVEVIDVEFEVVDDGTPALEA